MRFGRTAVLATGLSLLSFLAVAEEGVDIGTNKPRPPAAAYSNPLDARVTVRLKQAPLRSYLQEIERQSKLHFNIVPELKNCTVSAFFRDRSARTALQLLLVHSNLSYQQLGRSDTFTVTPRLGSRECPPLPPPLNRPFGLCRQLEDPAGAFDCLGARLVDFTELAFDRFKIESFLLGGFWTDTITAKLSPDSSKNPMQALGTVKSARVEEFNKSGIYVITSR